MLNIPGWKSFIILLVCFLGTLFAVPSFLTEKQLSTLPDWFPRQQVNLGLDLQGGSHILLEVDVKTGIHDRLGLMLEDMRKSFRAEKIGYTGLAIRGQEITFKLRNAQDSDKIKSLVFKLDKGYDVVPGGNDTFALQFQPSALHEIKKNIMSQSVEIVNRRINELGTREPNIQRQGEDRIIVQLPGVQDPSHVKGLLGKTAKLTFRMVHEAQPYAESLHTRAPAGTEVLESKDGHVPFYIIEKQVQVTGESLVDAQPSYDEYGGPQVAFRLNNIGGRKFAEITQNNIGKMFAIVLDKQVISAPRINSVIPSGSGVITGKFTVQEANDLALLMRAGALPAPLQVIEERTVGPDLGADSIAAGKIATVSSVILVALLMVVLYVFFGFVANIALIFNLVLLVSALALTSSTLTLPGIAGIALTMGMAVDANVLIFERIKEELRLGTKMVPAIDAGYTRAMATILDSNITTLIGAAALYIFGSGPIKGFGVTLALGIVISMFTAISFTRLVVAYWLKWFKPKTLSI